MFLKDNLSYKVYNSIEIESIQERLTFLDSNIWTLDKSRQGYNRGPHNKTHSLILQYCRGEPEIDENFFKMFPLYKTGKIPTSRSMFIYPTKEEFHKDIKNIREIVVDEELNLLTKKIVSNLEKKFDGTSALVVFTKLPAGKIIHFHKDPGYYLSVVHRLHIPIFTNKNCLFLIGSDIFHMEEGILYEINNLMLHGVKNDGVTDRIHLIIDIIPNNLVTNL